MTLVPLALITSLILVAITGLLVLSEERKLAVIRVPVEVKRRKK